MGCPLKALVLPTLLFVCVYHGLDAYWDLSYPLPLGVFAAVALLIAPIVWSWVVVRRRSIGIKPRLAAGAICGAAMALIPTIQVIVKFNAGPHTRESGLGAPILLFYFFAAWNLSVPLGAGIGAVTYWLQAFQRHRDPGL